MAKVHTILTKTLMVFFVLVLFSAFAEAKAGCCSWHGGVREDGCGCKDGTPLSDKCAPYYTCTQSQTQICQDGNTKCIGTSYFVCSNGEYASKGQVDGKCGYSAPISDETNETQEQEEPQNQSTIENETGQEDGGNNIKIANWNIQTFGPKKASNDALMNFYTDKIDDYDIIFIQEIRDKTGNSFAKLCSMLPEYNCNISSRAGSWWYKEQYGIIYRKDIQIIDFTDYNPDKQKRWERPPVMVVFNASGYIFTAYDLHAKPANVAKELASLQSIISDEGNIIVLGDLNADCSYYNNKKETQFDDWHWIIGDYGDTTVASNVCAYDRIILNDNAYNEYSGYGIDTQGITKQVSDHYLIWVEIKI